MRAVVIGGCGFIGSHLVDSLLKDGHSVLIVDNLSTGSLTNIQQHQENNNLEILKIDITIDKEALKDALVDAEFVFHLAALADIVPSVENPEKYFKANVVGTLNVLEAVKAHGKIKKFIYSASSSCYGLPENFPTKETDLISPMYPYALTKKMGEDLVLHWGELYKIPVISLRFFNVFGPRSRTKGTYGAVFGVFLAQKLAGKAFTVVGDGKQSRDFTFVTDVVDAIVMASKSKKENEVYNIGSGNHYSILRLVELLGGEIEFIPKRPGEPDCTFADISKIRKGIGWCPKVDFEKGIEIMLENIDNWASAPVWSSKDIERETKAWFEALKEK